MSRLVYAVAASAAVCAHTTSPAQAAQPRAVVEGALDGDLREAVQRAIGETDRPIDNRFEARRRARAAAEDAIAVLRSEGYYAYDVEAEVGDGDTPTAQVKIDPGPRFVIADPRIDWVGETPDAPVATAAAESLHLETGSPGRAADVVGAEGRAVATVQKRGYADAKADPREVVVDHADHTVRPTYRIVAGRIVRLDGVELVTKGRTNPAWVTRLTPWTPGAPYDPESVAELERRLLDAGVYESVTVALAPADKTTTEGLRPVVVSLADRKPHTVELGGSYASVEGFGLDAKWTRYNILGRADTLAVTGRLSQIDSRLGADLSLPHWRRPQQTLKTGASAYRTRTDAYDETGIGVRADVQRRYGKISYVTVGASVDLSRTDELTVDATTALGRDLVTLGALGDVVLDRSDDPLDPKQGWRVSARAEPTMILGQVNLPYLKLQAQGTGYIPLDRNGRTVVAGRLHVGSIVNGTIPEIPASKRFFAGGGGSVRGYAYQAVGPRLADGTPKGGASLVEASLEARHNLSSRWGVAAFVDAGTVGTSQYPTFGNLAVGAGVGVRYNLGFGPLRFDVAAPLTRRRGEAPFQIYVSIGQSF